MRQIYGFFLWFELFFQINAITSPWNFVRKYKWIFHCKRIISRYELNHLIFSIFEILQEKIFFLLKIKKNRFKTLYSIDSNENRSVWRNFSNFKFYAISKLSPKLNNFFFELIFTVLPFQFIPSNFSNAF